MYADTCNEGSSNQIYMTREEYEEVSRFHKNPNWNNRKAIFRQYFSEDKTSQFLLKNVSIGAITVLSTTTIGVTVGGCCGGPYGAAVGAAAGFGVGVTIVIVAGTYYNRQHFLEWKKGIYQSDLLAKFILLHQEHPLLRPFECTISHEILDDAVHLKCGHVFERVSIENQYNFEIKSGKSKVVCPECRRPFVLSDIEKDYLTIGKMKQVYAKIVLDQMEDPQVDPVVKEGFIALGRDLEVQCQNLLKNEGTNLQILLNSNRITPQAWGRRIAELRTLIPDENEADSETLGQNEKGKEKEV